MIAIILMSFFIWSQDSVELPPPSSGELPPELMQELSSPTSTSLPPAEASASASQPNAAANPFSETDLPFKFVPSSDGFTYDPSGLRNPFKPSDFVASAPADVPMTSADDGETPMVDDPALPGIERYDVTQYSVSAIIWNTTSPKVLVLDPNGKTWILKLKDRMGRRGGIIAKIREGEIVVVEPPIADGSNSNTLILTIKK